MSSKKRKPSLVNEAELQAWILTIGRTIASERARHGDISQEDLANDAGISLRTLTSLERGKKSAGIDKVLRCLLAMKMDIWTMFGGKGATRPQSIQSQSLHDLLDECLKSGDQSTIQSIRDILSRFAVKS